MPRTGAKVVIAVACGTVAAIGCASGPPRVGSSTSSDKHPLESIYVIQDFPADVRMESITASYVDALPEDRCAAGRPVQLDVVMRKEGQASRTALAHRLRCLTTYSRATVLIRREAGTGQFYFGPATRAPGPAPAAPAGGGTAPPSLPAPPPAAEAEAEVEVEVPRPPAPATPAVTKERLIAGGRVVLPAQFRAQKLEPLPRYGATVCVRTDGSVAGVIVWAERHHPELDARVFDAVRRWKYQPATLNGNPVPACPVVRIPL